MTPEVRPLGSFSCPLATYLATLAFADLSLVVADLPGSARLSRVLVDGQRLLYRPENPRRLDGEGDLISAECAAQHAPDRRHRVRLWKTFGGWGDIVTAESAGYSGLSGARLSRTLPPALLYELLAVLAGGAYRSIVLGLGKPSLV